MKWKKVICHTLPLKAWLSCTQLLIDYYEKCTLVFKDQFLIVGVRFNDLDKASAVCWLIHQRLTGLQRIRKFVYHFISGDSFD